MNRLLLLITIGLLVYVVVLLSRVGESEPRLPQTAGAVVADVRPTPSPTHQVTASVVQSQPTRQAPSGGQQLIQAVAPQAQELSIQQAVALCAQAGCNAAQWEPLVEANGSTNPWGKHFEGHGRCYQFQLPAWASGQFWDGQQAINAQGPTTLPRVCAASVRGNPGR